MIGNYNTRYNMTNEKHSLSWKAQRFIKSTDKFLIQNLRPGGIYNGIWCRDASYILKDWYLSGKVEQTLRQALQYLVLPS